jgi:3-dehydroquinate synthase
MSALFDVTALAGRYSIEMSAGLYRRVLNAEKNVVVICDARFSSDCEQAGMKYVSVDSIELTKSLSAIPDIIAALRKIGATRDTCLLAIGGGIVQDVAAFCAAIYMRGLEWVYIPTTLLGMVDSCIGGKSSINVHEYKNLVGTYNPPQRVLIDPEFTTTLSKEQIVAGLIEAAKISFCRGAETWRTYLGNQPSPHLDPEGYARIIATSLNAKKWFIEIDEFDRKERLLLNFGHTFGHALEGASAFRVGHGIAVGIGVLCALALGRLRDMRYAGQPQVTALQSHIRDLLGYVEGLPKALQGVTPAALFDRFVSDKKHRSDNYRVVMVNEQGAVELASLPKTDEIQKQIILAMEEILNEFRQPLSAVAGMAS